MSGRGYNPMHGEDLGPQPPGFEPAQRAGSYPYPIFGNYVWPPAQSQAPVFWSAPPPTYVTAAPAAQPMMPPYQYPYQYQYAPNFGHAQPAPAPPATDGGFPGIHLRNHLNGIGLPPGHDYMFPRDHTRIHCFTTGKEKPWQMTNPLLSWDTTKHVKLYVPSSTTVKELMLNLGCDNADAKKNVLYEVTEVGNGKWVKGLTIVGDDKDRMKKAISDFGWDKSRTGEPGQKPIVWLYVTKD